MFLFRKLSSHLKEQKLSYLILLLMIFVSFISGCFYANLVSDAELMQGCSQANAFIEEAKNNALSFHLMLTEELSPFVLIILFSLFLFGFFPILFLIFKQGFSSGFLLTFLVKCFFLKGFFLGGVFLLINLLFFLPAFLVLTRKALSLNRFLLSAALNRGSSQKTLSEELIAAAAIILGAILSVMVGVALKYLLLPILSNYLFL